ncbi:bile acid:sodium symporter [Kaistia sp. 32K]|uniref:bile acid:sodium symporter family protein n=1 Tax=Kaistia sp. 32K TaxID=2795690 RepID=UPI0019156C77|nr:bile acid:sodium symporter family protein [Kaistia sp. 32K]BCP52204.1 bile acid:sodium symporter [Kaistia sp. 32K]
MPSFRLPFKLPIDGYVLALLATVAIAAVLPAHGIGAEIMDKVTYLAVGLLFFLYGARLSPKAIVEGILHWRLQSLVFISTFVLFPLVGLALTTLLKPLLGADLAFGLMFLAVLPSTVQSSIAFTSIARGNVPAALCSASVSNILGILLTPALVALLLSSHGGGLDLTSLRDIGLQLLLPFALGQLARPLLGNWIVRHKQLTSFVDRGSILLIVYAAFSEGMVAGIWSQLTWSSLSLVVIIDVVMLAIVLIVTTWAARRLGFSKADEIAIVFCGSKKSMASGIPMANILFAGQSVGLIVLPLMLFHQLQLIACAAMARRYAARADTPA